jgi:dihydrofolate synthase/folylpolyglutamate synthase
MSPDPDSVEEWLLGFVRPDAPRGVRAQLASAQLLARLDDPQDRVRAVHVVGTAGKGTVARIVAASLRSAGGSVGLHQSPHVHDIRERFMVADELPPWEEVVAAIEEIRLHVDALVTAGEPPTFFALTTAIALVMARRISSDWLVVEAGIGGRADATNVFGRADVVTAVTAIGLDHTDVLGQTVGAIAIEKTAVFAGRTTAVLGPQPFSEAVDVAQAAAIEHGVRLVEVAATNDWRHDAEATAAAVLAELDPSAPDPVFSSQPGRYEQVKLPGIRPSRWIFDGAHNPMKLKALVGPLRSEPGSRLGVVSVGEGKDLAGCADAIASALDAAIVVPFGPMHGEFGPQSHPTSALADAFRAAGVADVIEATDANAAVAIATARGEVSTVVVTGSFLHLNDVRRALLRRGTLMKGT